MEDGSVPVIGIGASAGGLEALQEFFDNMPYDTGMAFIVIQHLSPDYKSLMDELLSRVTSMKIFKVEDGMKVSPDCIYLIPPRKNMTIFHHKLFLEPQNSSHGLNLPIDIFLRSLAKDMGKNAIGIILSGTGSDGTMGIRAIKEAGGMVMAQDNRSAKFDGMPRSSISTGLVDYILTPAKMPQELINYIKHPFIKKPDKAETALSEDEDLLSRIIMIIRDNTGIDFTFYKESTIIRRLEKRISINHLSNIAEYVNFLNGNVFEVNILYKELLIGVTRFFRDLEAFEILKEKVIPEIFDKKNPRDQLRIWSVGCSTGEEAYSLSMMLHEYMEENNINLDVKIFATDIDKEALEFAGAGIFPESIVSDISPEVLSKYFTRKEEGYQVNEHIRKMVIFASHNVLKDPPFSKIDLVICRNMLIYLKQDVQHRILSMFYFALQKHGFLFLGSSESVGELSSGFIPINSKWKIYRYKSGYQPSMSGNYFIPPVSKSKSELRNTITPHKYVVQKHHYESIFNELLNIYVPPSVIINDNYEILHVFNDVNRFLSFPAGKVNLNILKMVSQEIAVILGSLLRKVKKEEMETTYKNVKLSKNNHHYIIDIVAKYVVDNKSNQSFFIVSFIEHKNDAPSTGYIEKIDVENQYHERLAELEKELQYTKESLQATVEELETSNEELQSSNEELIASNEELQSTNQELQSVNEELYTVNSEYQNKIEELTQLNNDMNNLLSSTKIGTLFLDRKLCIRKFTKVVSELTNIMNADIGRSISHISMNRIYDHFLDDIEDVLEHLTSKEVEIQNKNGEWYLIKILPYRTEDNAVDGVAITFINITTYKQAEEKVDKLTDRLEASLNMGNLAWWEWDYTTGRVIYSEMKARLLGYEEGEIAEHVDDWINLIHPDDYEVTMQKMRDHLQGKTEVYETEYRLKSKNGEWLWFFDKGGVVERDYTGKPLKINGVVMEISSKKNLEKNKEQQEKLLYNILDNSPIAKTMVDKTGHITYANKKAEQLLGISQENIKKRSYDDVKWEITDQEGKPIPEEELPFSIVMRTGKPVKNFKHYIKNSDKKILLSINGAPIFDEREDLKGVVFTLEELPKTKEN